MASRPQGSSERVLPWQITMDQLIFASLSPTHYWYEVGMLKVPAIAYIGCENLLVLRYRSMIFLVSSMLRVAHFEYCLTSSPIFKYCPSLLNIFTEFLTNQIIVVLVFKSFQPPFLLPSINMSTL